MFRRSKLAFLNNKDDRTKIINERVHLAERHINELSCTFSECTRKLAKCRDSYDELAKSFKNYADNEELNESFSNGLKRLTTAVTILGDYMDTNVHRMEKKIVVELAQYENLCKSTRDSLRLAYIARDKEAFKQRQITDLQNKFSANGSAAESDLLKSKIELQRANKEIENIISNFEMRKLVDIKNILTDFVLISMKYHTKTLEALSACYYDVSNIDEQNDIDDFKKLIKIKDETQTRTKKAALRSKSMENLDRDKELSPLKQRVKITRSSKNLTDRSENDDEDDDDEEDDEDDESDATNSNSNSNEDSDTISDNADSDTTIDQMQTIRPSALKPKLNVNLKQPFKAVTTAHVLKRSINNSKYEPFAARRNIVIARRSAPQLGVTSETSIATPLRRASGRLVTVVGSKQRRAGAECDTSDVGGSSGGNGGANSAGSDTQKPVALLYARK